MGRGSRWALGLVVSGLLALGALISAAVAFGQAVGPALDSAATSGGCLVYDYDDYCVDDRLTARAPAVVLDVDSSYGPTLDVEFDSPSEHVVTSFDWPSRAGVLPARGNTIRVAYDPDDPEYLITLASALDSMTGSAGSGAVGSGAAPEGVGGSGSAWDDGRGAAWMAGGFTLAALLALVLTWWWARRAPAPAPIAPAAGPYGFAGYGYPPTGHPGYGYGFAGYGHPGAGYPNAGYPNAGYPNAGYPGVPAQQIAAPARPGPVDDGPWSAPR